MTTESAASWRIDRLIYSRGDDQRCLVDGRGAYSLNIGGIKIDAAVTAAFLAALEPAGLAATAPPLSGSRAIASPP